RKAKITSEDATTPAAVAVRCLSARNDRKNGRKVPKAMFHTSGIHGGNSSSPTAPPNCAPLANTVGSTSHHPLKTSQNAPAKALVQNATASGDTRVTWRSPTRKYSV